MNLVERYVIPDWELEPDHREFEYKGYLCMIKRNPSMLFLCGYVAIPDFHPERDSYMLEDLSPHGGITYNQFPDKNSLPKWNSSGQKLYWVGFDCGHACDLAPGLIKVIPQGHAVYRNMGYVRQEIRDMVDQIIENIYNRGGRR